MGHGSKGLSGQVCISLSMCMCINKLHKIMQSSNHLSLTQEHNDFWLGLGPVCVMYSRMGLGLKEMDVGFKTHEAFYKQYAKVCDVLTIENVTEYPRDVVQKHLGPNWSIQDVQVDPRNVGLGMGRARSFFIAYRNDKIQWNATYSLESFLECPASKSALSAGNYFWQNHPEDKLSQAEDSCL